MRRLLLLPAILLLISIFIGSSELKAQVNGPQRTVELFCEDFDSTDYNGYRMTRVRQPASATVLFFKDSVITNRNTRFSATDTVGNRTSSYLVSPFIQLELDSFNSYGISYDHICYIDQFDDAVFEYRFNNGPWDRAPSQVSINGDPRDVYTGNSLYLPRRAFSKISRPEWPNLDDSLEYNAQNSQTAWVPESFEMYPLIQRFTQQNSGTPPDSFQVRIGLVDNPASAAGRTGFHQYWVDNFCIKASNCEQEEPSLTLEDPPVNYPARYEDRVYRTFDYIFDAQISDRSLLSAAYIEYIVRRDTANGVFGTVLRDTVDFNFLGFSRYRARLLETGDFINSITNQPDSIQIRDSIYWQIVAIDNSPCLNKAEEPNNGFESFQVRGNLPKGCATQPVFNFPYVQDFNGASWTNEARRGSGALFDSWLNAEGDFHDWYVWSDSSLDYPTTGPSDDIPGGGNYLILEATGFRDSTAYLLSPCIDLFNTQNNLVRFYLNQNGDGGDTVHLDIFDPTPILPNFPDGRFISDIIPPIGGNKGDNWLPYEFNTYDYRDKVVQLRWRATPASATENSDIALDSFKIVPSFIHDLRMDRVVLGQFAPLNVSDPVRLRVQNLGALPNTAFTVSYEVVTIADNVVRKTVNNVPINTVIQPGENVAITLDPQYNFNVPLGEYYVRAWLDYSLDQNQDNDTTLANSTGLFYNPSIGCDIEYFDDDTLWVSLGNDSATFRNKWEIGTPDYDRTNSAFTMPNSWDVLLNRGYAGSGSVEQLITRFYSTQGADSVIMSFMNNRAMENTQDGVFIEYSLDRGNTWDYLENVDDTTLRKRWYNSFLSSGGFGGQFALSDTTRNMPGNWNNWVESEIMLPDNLEDQEEVLFRFIFFAEEEPGGSGGMSVDNFVLYDQTGTDIQPQFIVRPFDNCDLPATQPFTTVFKNRGANPVDSFPVTYIVDGPAGYQTVTEMVRRRIEPRDTIRVVSEAKFDFSVYGFYEATAVTDLSIDNCTANDTLTKVVENIDGCEFIFRVNTGPFPAMNTVIDSSFWRFDYTNDGKEYVITDNYDLWPSNDTIDSLICIKNGSDVRFTLGDIDSAVSTYSLIAFNGENDTILVNQETGGPSSPVKYFNWICPPPRSAKLLDIIVTTDSILPFEGFYNFQVNYLNNGLDSIKYVEVGLRVDDSIQRINDTINLVEGLKYNRNRILTFDSRYLKPGLHEFCAWTHDPNNQPDLKPDDDSLCMDFVVIDTTLVSGALVDDSSGNPVFVNGAYCTTFEDTAKFRWIAVNPYKDTANITRTQRAQTFERATPATARLNSAYSGQKAWVTNDSGNYKNVDSTSLLSPFFRLNADSCYKVSFRNNYVIRDQFNDGGQFQMSTEFGREGTWRTIYYGRRDSVTLGDTTIQLINNFQKNWHNANHIKAIPNNLQNSGWTGESNGWVLSENIFGGVWTPVSTIGGNKNYLAVFRFRFESDATVTDEGWAIDDFCLRTINPLYCKTVGLEEELAKNIGDEVYIGQNIPNPAREKTSIPYYLPNNVEMNLNVINVMGQLMYTESSTKLRGSGYIDLDLSNYAQGIYYYTIEIDGKKYTHKMVVTK